MPNLSLSHVADHVLLRDLAALVRQDQATTATLLAHLAEVDRRRLYAPAGYPTMSHYCVDELGLSPDVAAKRVQAARAIGEFPALLAAVTDGRLQVSGVVLLAPHLTSENLDQLVASTARQSKKDIRAILAQRFPRPGAGLPAVPLELDGPADAPAVSANVTVRDVLQDPDPVVPADAGETGQSMVPLSPAANAAPPTQLRFPLHATITAETREKLAYARDLLGHAVPGGDIAEVLDRALDALIERLEKRRFAATARSRPARGSGTNERGIPARVRREVGRRDGWSCTFVGDGGHPCDSRALLQFDHVVPLARGGQTTVGNLRLLCRTHNQLEAERKFGVAFMRGKRERVKRAAEARAAASNGKAAEPARSTAAEEAEHGLQRDVIAGLRNLGFRADEARRAAALSAGDTGSSLEARLRTALQSLAPPGARRDVPNSGEAA